MKSKDEMECECMNEEFDSREEFEKRIKESKSDGINIEKCIIGEEYDYVVLFDE